MHDNQEIEITYEIVIRLINSVDHKSRRKSSRSHPHVFCKKVILKNFTKFTEKAGAIVSFLIK